MQGLPLHWIALVGGSVSIRIVRLLSGDSTLPAKSLAKNRMVWLPLPLTLNGPV